MICHHWIMSDAASNLLDLSEVSLNDLDEEPGNVLDEALRRILDDAENSAVALFTSFI